MSAPLQTLHAFVSALVERERSLVRVRAALHGALLVAGVAALAWVAAWLDVRRPVAVVWLTLVLGIGAWFAVIAPWRVGMARARDRMRQARQVEAMKPGLRGRLITVTGHEAGVRGAESEALLALAARRARAEIADMAPEAVHPGDDLSRRGWAALLAWATVALAVWLGPLGPNGVMNWWWTGDAVRTGVADATEGEGAAAARVGDLTLRYVYPDYTGLAPYEVANSTGEAHAPPGTRVEVVARSAEVVDAATLVAYDGPPLGAAIDEDRRNIRGDFVVRAESGTYSLRMKIGEDLRVSPSFLIEPELDLAPEVSLEAEADVIEVPADAPLSLPWMARDDYGISRVQVKVDGDVEPRALRVPPGRVAELSGLLDRSPADLGMVPGETYKLSIVAADNDTVSGSKLGESNVVEVVVLGDDGVARLTEDKRRMLLDLMVRGLGRQLEDVYPPGATSGAYARWGITVRERFAELVAFVDAHYGPRTSGPEWLPVLGALEDIQTLVRYSQVSFSLGSPSRANDGSVQAIATFRDDARESLETAILHIDGLIQAKAFSRIAESAERLEQQAEGLHAELDREGANAIDVASVGEELNAVVDAMNALSSDLAPRGFRTFLESRTEEMAGLVAEARGALDEANLPVASMLTERATDRLNELAQGIREEIDRRRERSEEQQKKADELLELLKALAGRQDALADRVQSIQEEGGASYREQVSTLWTRIETMAKSVLADLEAFRGELDAPGRQPVFPDFLAQAEQVIVEAAIAYGAGAVDSAVARDLSGMRPEVEQLQRQWRQQETRFESQVARLGTPPGPSASDQRAIRSRIVDLLDLMEQLRRLDAAGDPALRGQVREVRPVQEALAAELEDAKADARRAVQEMPVTPRDLMPSLEAAGERMDQAATELQQGDGMQGQGSQQAAAQHIRDAIAALQQASRSAAQQAGEAGARAPAQEDEDADQEGQRPGEGDEKYAGSSKVKLPSPEDHLSPEAYRAMLLQGMQGDVPEEYRALKRRYYEELVHQ